MLEANNLPDYYKSLLKNYKLYIAALILIAILASIFSVSVDYKVKEIIDSIVSNSKSNIGYLIGLFVFYCVKNILQNATNVRLIESFSKR